MECFGTTDFDNNSRLITLSAIIISGLHCISLHPRPFLLGGLLLFLKIWKFIYLFKPVDTEHKGPTAIIGNSTLRQSYGPDPSNCLSRNFWLSNPAALFNFLLYFLTSGHSPEGILINILDTIQILHHSLPVSLPYQNRHYFEFTILFSLKVSLEKSCNLDGVFSVPQ
jgi:hypothetical protein